MISSRTILVLTVTIAFAAQTLAEADDAENYIVGGRTAERGQFPSFVSIRRGRSHMCGATLINARWSLTSAHCIEPQKRFQLDLITAPRRDEKVHRIVRVVIHPQFNKGRRANDIGMVATDRPVVLSNQVQPVKLPTTNLVPGETPVPLTIVGLGYLERPRRGAPFRKPRYVQFAQTYNAKLETCRNIMASPRPVLNEHSICSDSRAYRGTCWRDGGSPVYHQSGVLVAIVSWESLCGQPGRDVFTRVLPFRSFIEQVARS